MKTDALVPFLITALNAAEKARADILTIYQGTIDVDYKEDRSPLTAADKASHETITGHLTAGVKPFPILSEESKKIEYLHRKPWEYYWVVDPLDGTKEFIKKNDEFTVNIALMHINRPILGVICIPVQNVYYIAMDNIGAHKIRGEDLGTIQKTVSFAPHPFGILEVIYRLSRKLPFDNTPTERNKTVTIVGSRSHATQELNDYVATQEKAGKKVIFVSAGSSLKFCLVANGSADVYPRHGPTMEWDTAAGQIIVEQAGGLVLDANTLTPLKYNKEDLLNPWFIVQATPGG